MTRRNTLALFGTMLASGFLFGCDKKGDPGSEPTPVKPTAEFVQLKSSMASVNPNTFAVYQDDLSTSTGMMDADIKGTGKVNISFESNTNLKYQEGSLLITVTDPTGDQTIEIEASKNDGSIIAESASSKYRKIKYNTREIIFKKSLFKDTASVKDFMVNALKVDPVQMTGKVDGVSLKF